MVVKVTRELKDYIQCLERLRYLVLSGATHSTALVPVCIHVPIHNTQMNSMQIQPPCSDLTTPSTLHTNSQSSVVIQHMHSCLLQLFLFSDFLCHL